MTKEQIFQKRYSGIAPEGFILLTEEAMDKLRDFDTWKKWKNNEMFEIGKGFNITIKHCMPFMDSLTTNDGCIISL